MDHGGGRRRRDARATAKINCDQSSVTSRLNLQVRLPTRMSRRFHKTTFAAGFDELRPNRIYIHRDFLGYDDFRFNDDRGFY